jgi:hypothetical protein
MTASNQTSPAAKKLTIADKKAWVISKLDASQRNVELAVLAIFKRQTADEQATNSTNNNNSMGFNGLDAEFGSSLAKNITKYGKLTPNQAGYARKLIGKYWAQLVEVAEAKGTLPGSTKVVATIIAPEAKQAPSVRFEEGCADCGCTEFHDGEDCPVSGRTYHEINARR